jgi:hypothetical protein
MAIIDFPSNPIDGQEYTANGIVWVYVASVPAWHKKYHLPASAISSNPIGNIAATNVQAAIEE